jgi:tetratricopeptide (TPR) repeat protein
MLIITSRSGKDIMLLLAAVTLFAGCSPPGARALLKGIKLLDEGQYQLAVEELRGATVLLGNTNAQAFNYLGLACHQAGQNSEAERAYQRALTLNPDLVEARFNLGCLLLSENRLDQARAELTAFTLRRGNSVEGWRKLGSAQLRSRDFGGAEKSFVETLRLAPQDPEALTGIGLVRLQHNRSPREAAQFFSNALKAQPDYSAALLNLAIVAEENLKDRSLALRTYREYLALKPTPSNSEAVKVIVRQLEQEIAPPQRMVVASNSEPRVITNQQKPTVTELPRTNTPPPPKIIATETSRPIATAKAELTNVTPKTAPPTNIARPTPIATAATQSDFQVVKVPAEPVLKLAEDGALSSQPAPTPYADTSAPATTVAPTNSATKQAKRSFFQKINPINLFSSDGKNSSSNSMTNSKPVLQANTPPAEGGSSSSSPSGPARYPYRSPLELPAGNRPEAESAFAQGAKAYQAQDLTGAIAAYRRATETDPSFFDAQYNLGLAAFEQGRLRTALAAYENAVAILPESEEARYNFALALKQANYPVDAANELEKVLTLYPNNARAHLALGNLFAQQLQQPTKAREHYRKVLEIDPRNPQAAAVRDWLTTTPK